MKQVTFDKMSFGWWIVLAILGAVTLLFGSQLRAEDKPPQIPQELQTKVALLALDARTKGAEADKAVESAKAASKASQDVIAELAKACGDGYEWRNDLTHFWCEAKPAEAKK